MRETLPEDAARHTHVWYGRHARALATKAAWLRWHTDPTFNHAHSAIEIAERFLLLDESFEAGVVKLLEPLVEVLAHLLDHSVDVIEDCFELGLHDFFMLGERVLKQRELLLVFTELFEYQCNISFSSRCCVLLSVV